MLTIVRRGGATHEKPPEIVRGQSSRLPWAWDSLCFAVPFNDSTRGAARDLVYNAAPTTATGLQWTRDNRGNTVALLDAASYLEYPDTPAHNKPATELTAYVRLCRNGASDFAGGIFGKRYDTADPYLSWALYMSDVTTDATQGHLTISGQPYENIRDTYVLPTDKWVSIFLRWRSGSIPTMFVLGERGDVLSTSIYSLALTGTIPYVAGQPIRINASDDSAQNSNAAYSQAMLWSRVLTDVEVQALVSDPYGWYSPRRETIGLSSPYPLVFGGGEMKFGTGSGGLR